MQTRVTPEAARVDRVELVGAAPRYAPPASALETAPDANLLRVVQRQAALINALKERIRELDPAADMTPSPPLPSRMGAAELQRVRERQENLIRALRERIEELERNASR